MCTFNISNSPTYPWAYWVKTCAWPCCTSFTFHLDQQVCENISSLIASPYHGDCFPRKLGAHSHWLFGVTWHVAMELFPAKKSLFAKSVTSLDNSCTVTSDFWQRTFVFPLNLLMSLLSRITKFLITSPSGNQLPSNAIGTSILS